MKKMFSLAVGALMTLSINAQNYSTEKLQFFQQKEDSLRHFAELIIDGYTVNERLLADSLFTRILVRALKEDYSFQFPFDSLYTTSRLYAPDSSFRIITWQIMLHENRFWQRGTIQMNTKDGSLKIYPLVDRSEITAEYQDTTGDNTAWIGAVYYNIIQKDFEGKNYYTLLGFDDNSIRSNKKIIEVLDFNSGQPHFGGSFFSPGNHARYVMEYKKGAGVRMNYDSELDIIVKEDLISESGEPKKKFTLVGNGDYDGFKWFNGKWFFIEKIFADMPIDNTVPVPAPLTESKFDFEEATKDSNKENPSKKKKGN